MLPSQKVICSWISYSLSKEGWMLSKRAKCKRPNMFPINSPGQIFLISRSPSKQCCPWSSLGEVLGNMRTSASPWDIIKRQFWSSESIFVPRSKVIWVNWSKIFEIIERSMYSTNLIFESRTCNISSGVAVFGAGIGVSGCADAVSGWKSLSNSCWFSSLFFV